MTTLGDQFGKPGLRREGYSSGIPLGEVTPAEPVRWGPFRGLNLSVPPENLEASDSADALDMEVDLASRLVKAPGITALEALAHVPTAVAGHPKLNQTTDLILFAPPFIGVKTTGPVVWTDIGLDARKIAHTLYADTLLFTDQRRVWSRDVNGVISQEPGVPPSHSMTVFGGRLVMGYTLVNGNMEALANSWSGAAGNFRDYGIGSGTEFMLSEQVVGDYHVAHRVINLDFLASLNRRSIWIARLTGSSNVPFRWEVRLRGVGCVSAETAWSTDEGVLFLSDDGVRLFNGNSAPIISESINSALLPLVNDGVDYGAFYDSTSKRYVLFTPTESWVLDLPRKRWFRWSTVLKAGASFPTQQAQETWATTAGTWDSDVGTWADLVAKEGADRVLFLKDDELGVQDGSVMTAFGVPFTPRWDLPLKLGVPPDTLFSHEETQVVYEGSGVAEIRLPDNAGQYTNALACDLTGQSPRVCTAVSTGLGVGASVRILSGNPRIRSIYMSERAAGRRVS